MVRGVPAADTGFAEHGVPADTSARRGADGVPAAVVAVGMFEGASWGAIFGLVLGIFADMDYVENTVMFTLLLPALAFFAGFVSQFFINRRFFAYMGAAFAAV